MPLYKAEDWVIESATAIGNNVVELDLDKQNSDLAARVKAMLYVGNNAVSLLPSDACLK